MNKYTILMVPFGGAGPVSSYVEDKNLSSTENDTVAVTGSHTRFGPDVLKSHPLFKDFLKQHPQIQDTEWIDVSPETVAHWYGVSKQGEARKNPGGITYYQFQKIWTRQETNPAPLLKFFDALKGTPSDPRALWPGIEQTLPRNPFFGRNMLDVLTTAKFVGERIKANLSQNRIPIVIGGDHSVNLGVFEGLAQYFTEQVSLQRQNLNDTQWKFPKDSIGSKKSVSDTMKELLDILWLDAHADIHTLQTSESHNIHGMPVSSALGLCALQGGLPILCDLGGVRHKLSPDRVTYLGLRDLDVAEIEMLERWKIAWFSSKQILTNQVNVSSILSEHLCKNPEGFSLFSADLDGLDPLYAPCVTTDVPEGLTLEHYLEALKILHKKRGRDRVLIYEIYEFNPYRLGLDGQPTLSDQDREQTIKSILSLLDEMVD